MLQDCTQRQTDREGVRDACFFIFFSRASSSCAGCTYPRASRIPGSRPSPASGTSFRLKALAPRPTESIGINYRIYRLLKTVTAVFSDAPKAHRAVPPPLPRPGSRCSVAYLHTERPRTRAPTHAPAPRGTYVYCNSNRACGTPPFATQASRLRIPHVGGFALLTLLNLLTNLTLYYPQHKQAHFGLSQRG